MLGWTSTSPHLYDRILGLSRAIAEAGLWGQDDVDLAVAWLRDLVDIGYVAPAVRATTKVLPICLPFGVTDFQRLPQRTRVPLLSTGLPSRFLLLNYGKISTHLRNPQHSRTTPSHRFSTSRTSLRYAIDFVSSLWWR